MPESWKHGFTFGIETSRRAKEDIDAMKERLKRVIDYVQRASPRTKS